MKNNVSHISSFVSRISYFVKKKSSLAFLRSHFVFFFFRDTFFSSPFTRDERRETRDSSHHSLGFTLIEVIGVLAVMATLMAIVAPTLIDQIDRAAEEAEAQSLTAIGQGVELYLRTNYTWPANLSALSPDYVPFGTAQLTVNDRGFPRYFIVHPDSSSYVNATGLAQSALADARFLLISNISSDASPSINNAAQFNTWWNTDDTTTPDLDIYRGHEGDLFHLVSISAVAAGGSYRLDGVTTNSSGSTLSSVGNYHLAGTVVEFDEDNTFSPGNFAFGITLVADAGYQFDPNCTAGTMWHVLGSNC